MTFQVTTLRTVYGSLEKITHDFATQTAAEAFAATVQDTAVVKNTQALGSDGKPALVGHYVKGAKTTQTHF